MTNINLGCGTNKLPGYINIDISKEVEPDMVLDLTNTFPFNTSFVDKIRAVDFFEHILNPIPVFNECWRVLRHNGELYVETPMAGSNDYYKDPSHVRPFVPDTFKYLSEYAEGYIALNCKPWVIKDMKNDENRIFVTMIPKK